MSVFQPVDTALVEEVDVFNEEAEERDDNLQESRRKEKELFREKNAGGRGGGVIVTGR